MGGGGGTSIIYGPMRDLFAFVNDEAKVKSTKCRQLAVAKAAAKTEAGAGAGAGTGSVAEAK